MIFKYDFFIGTASVQESVYHAGILFLNGAGFRGKVISDNHPSFDCNVVSMAFSIITGLLKQFCATFSSWWSLWWS